MCTVLKVHPSGYYKWLKQPISNLEIKNQQILQEIKKAYKESNGIYGYRNIHKDLKASMHISELPDSDAGVVPDTFAMRFSRV